MRGKSNNDIPNSCDGKQRYTSAEESNKFVANLNRAKKGRRMKTYFCIKCNGYHYGRNKQKKMDRNPSKKFIPVISVSIGGIRLKGEFYVAVNY